MSDTGTQPVPVTAADTAPGPSGTPPPAPDPSGTPLPAPGPSEREAGPVETVVGCIMVGLVLLGGLWFRSHPGPIFLDHWGFSLVHPANGNRDWQRITDLRSVSVLVAGSILAAVVVVTRDRWRALACLVAPSAAVLLSEYVLKPDVGRRYAEVLSYPSGTTTVVGSLAMAWALATPRRYRPVVAVIVAFVVGLECMAVVALQWHYPADALAGAVFGAGFVLLADGVLHLAVDAVRRRRSHLGPPEAPDPGPGTTQAV